MIKSTFLQTFSQGIGGALYHRLKGSQRHKAFLLEGPANSVWGLEAWERTGAGGGEWNQTRAELRASAHPTDMKRQIKDIKRHALKISCKWTAHNS